MILSQRHQRVVDLRCCLSLMPGSQGFAIAGLRRVRRGVETIPHSLGEHTSAAVGSEASHFAALHLATQRGPEIETAALSRTTSCPKVVAEAQAWRHMDHSPTAGQVSTARSFVSKATLWLLEATSRIQASKMPTSRALASGRGGERRGGWTFTLGTCRTDFPRFASLPRSMCTVTSVRGSLGSFQGEQRSRLSFIFWRAGTARRARPASFQDQSEVLVAKLGRAPYIGAGGARPTLDRGGLGGALPGSQYPRRLQRPFIGTVRERHERHEPVSPPREELGARWI
jgi:hypothetical protein